MSVPTVQKAPEYWPAVASVAATSPQQQAKYKYRIKQLLKSEDAVLVAHYYTDAAIQALAEETGGCVADSLEMARFGYQHSASTVIVAGVRFMGETAKILSPEKRVIMPDLAATCSLDLSCPVEEFSHYCDQYPDHTVVVYANTSAAVKARAHWVVTSSIAKEVIEHLGMQDKPIIWAPDKYLGQYLQRETGVNMKLWHGACVVHEEFKALGIERLKKVYPQAAVLVHPESPGAVIKLADVVGSTSEIIRAACTMPNPQFIVATDRGIFYKLNQLAPDKAFYEAPTAGAGAACRSCAHCPWMAMNRLGGVVSALEQPELYEIMIDPNIGKQALAPLQRMLDFKRFSAAA